MRFRRHRGRRSAEPLRWIRNSFLNTPFEVPLATTPVSIMPLFTPQTVFGGDIDGSTTVLRVIVNRFPVAAIDSGTTLLEPFVMDLTWFMYVRDIVETDIPLDPEALFSRGRDIIAGGSLYASFFGKPQIQPVYWPTGANFIDTKVNRVLQVNQQLSVFLMASVKPNCLGGTPFTPPAENNPACWVVDSDVSVLYKRTMRRR